MHVKEKDISAYVENSLPAEKQKMLAQHFSECKVCSRKLCQWESLFKTINELEYDFKLDGMEEKVLLKIRERQHKDEKPASLLPNFIHVFAFVFIACLFISPVTNYADQSFKYVGNFIFSQSIDFINEFKWHAVNIVSEIQAMDLAGWIFLLASGIILIAGGIYFSFAEKLSRKAARHH
jgi:hypothetical protein